MMGYLLSSIPIYSVVSQWVYIQCVYIYIQLVYSLISQIPISTWGLWLGNIGYTSIWDDENNRLVVGEWDGLWLGLPHYKLVYSIPMNSRYIYP